MLVVGAKGFVGASLVRSLLRRGHRVVSLELRDGPGRLADVAADVEWRTGDCADGEVLAAAIGRAGVDGIYFGPFYRRAPGQPSVTAELDVMAAAAWRTFQLARVLDALRILFPSSTAVHGPQRPGTPPVHETSQVWPHGVYGAAKLLTERVGEETNLALGRNAITSVRLPAVYGPGAAVASRRVNVPAVAAARGETGRVDYRPEARVCIAHVHDTGEMLADLFETAGPAHGVYELGGLDVSFADIGSCVAGLVPEARTVFGEDEVPILPHAVDGSRLAAEIGRKHRDLVEGMRSVVEYERGEAHVPA